MQPQEQSAFGRIAEDLRFISGEVEHCCRIYSNTLLYHLFVGITVKLGLVYLHPVARKSAGFIGAYDRSCTHGLAGMKLADEVVGAQHTPHRVCQRQSDSHWQTFRDGHHNQGDCNHKTLKEIGNKFHPLEIFVDKVHGYTPHDNSRRHNVAENRNHMAEAVELFVKRGFDAAIYLGSSEDFAILGTVADCKYPHYAMTFHYLCTSQHVVRRKCGFRVEMFGISSFSARRFAGKS